nr:MAG TPA: DNA pilot protein VP2 [Microviridae sp.]
MLQALLKNAGVFRPIGLNFSIGCFACGAGAKTKATNASNERIADKTNQMNYQMWQEQKDYDYQKWKEELAYNTPSAQRKRFEEAGINPNLAIAQMSGGNAESAATSGNRPDAIAAQMQNPAEEVSQYSQNLQNIAGGFNNMARTFQQNQLDAAQTRSVSVNADIESIERNYRAAQLEATINKLIKEGLLTDEQAKNLRVNTFINSQSAADQIKQKQFEAENAEKQGKVLDSVAELNLTNKVQSQVQTQILRTELRYLPRKLQVEIQKDLSEISVNAANALLLGEQKKLVREQVKTQVQATLSAKTDNKIKNSTVEAVTDRIFSEAGIAGAQSERKQRENYMDFHGDGINPWRVRHAISGK